MGVKKPNTPRSQVRSALRQLWLRSRERQAAIKRDSYTCQACGGKQSKAKGKEFAVEVHHIHGIGNWEAVMDAIYREILCDPSNMETLCKDCHGEREKCRKMEVTS